VWAAVVIVALYVLRRSGSHSERAATVFVIGGDVALSTVVLAALLPLRVAAGDATRGSIRRPALAAHGMPKRDIPACVECHGP